MRTSCFLLHSIWPDCRLAVVQNSPSQKNGWPADGAREESHPERAARFLQLTRSILGCAARGSRRTTFLREISTMILEFSGCDALELRHQDGDLAYRWQLCLRPQTASRFEILPQAEDPIAVLSLGTGGGLETIARLVLAKSYPADSNCFTDSGSFWSNDTSHVPAVLRLRGGFDAGECRSLAILPFRLSSADTGLLLLKTVQGGHFDPQSIVFYEGVAETLGLAAADRRTQEALRERVKELTCLYALAQIADTPGLSREEKLERIVRLLPPAWLHPEICTARLELDGWSCRSDNWREGPHVQRADIVIAGHKRGFVEVAYVDSELNFAGDPFLKEEGYLIAEVARNVAGLVERAEAETIRRREQVWHANRLATIGKLASGIAHELNEPLSSILGFAQLAKKELSDPQQLAGDLEKIVTVSLHAREVVRKLLIFARQMPARKSTVHINQVVRDALTLIETRCAVEGINVVLRLAEDLPEIEADSSQLSQVLVNLMVNAMQAMPQGGSLTIETAREPNCLLLTVEDTGVGMSADTQRQIFHPFFSTKDAQQGTGLGLSVVHGIVTSHGGTIQVRTSPGAGSRFEVRLPLSGATDSEEGK